jgi:hypothetical protein
LLFLIEHLQEIYAISNICWVLISTETLMNKIEIINKKWILILSASSDELITKINVFSELQQYIPVSVV